MGCRGEEFKEGLKRIFSQRNELPIVLGFCGGGEEGGGGGFDDDDFLFL